MFLLRKVLLVLQSNLKKMGIRLEISRTLRVNKEFKGAKYDEAYLRRIVNLLQEITIQKPRNILEVGANYAQDSALLQFLWHIDSNDIVVIEPIIEYCERIKSKYSFQVLNFAVSDETGVSNLWSQQDPSVNSGTASLNRHPLNDIDFVEVDTIRLDEVIMDLNWESIDFLKIDVEGHAYQVLESLGKFTENVNIIQLETEYIPVWCESKPEKEVFEFLRRANFTLVDYMLGEDGIQADSLWVKESFISRRIYSNKESKFLPWV